MMKPRYVFLGLILGLVYMWWQSREDHQSASNFPSIVSKVQKSEPAKTADVLTEIEGIGPAYERALNALGILTFEQLATQNADELATRMSARVTAERIQREKWIEQARARMNK